jgi:hypothetical protein
MPFLKIDPNPRTSAMGGTQIGTGGTAMAMFGNPAGLAAVNGLDVTSAVTNWIVDIKHYSGGAAYNLGNLGTFGVGFVWMDYGTFTKTTPVLGTADPALRNQGYIDEGDFTVSEYAVGISYARQISSQFSVGGQIKYATQDLGNIVIYDEFEGENVEVGNKVNNVILDFGTIYYPGFKDLRFGMSFRNFSNQSDYFDQRFELPLTFDFGLAMDLFTLLPEDAAMTQNNKFTLAFDWVHPRDYAERQHIGVEYSLHNALALRGGYRLNYDERGITAGVGFNLNVSGMQLKADYAYGNFGEFFGAVHRIALGAVIK